MLSQRAVNCQSSPIVCCVLSPARPGFGILPLYKGRRTLSLFTSARRRHLSPVYGSDRLPPTPTVATVHSLRTRQSVTLAHRLTEVMSSVMRSSLVYLLGVQRIQREGGTNAQRTLPNTSRHSVIGHCLYRRRNDSILCRGHGSQ